MIDRLYLLLAHPWSGIVIAGCVALAGVLVLLASRPHAHSRRAGFALCVLALPLAAGGILSTVRTLRAAAPFPVPGKLVDVGGYRMHLLAEGDAHDGPTLVWIPGGHGPGIDLYHLHKTMRAETRSILFDRPGSGWSDVGPFPRSTAAEADELHLLLQNAGERGPFILIGHSYGGLLAINYARRHPQQMAALVLLDATQPDVFTYMPGGGGPDLPAQIAIGSGFAAWKKTFGLPVAGDDDAPKDDAPLRELLALIRQRLAEVDPARRALSVGAINDWATASLFREWRDPNLVSELMVYDAELGSLPLWMMVPDDVAQTVRLFHLPADEERRTVNFLTRARLRYMAASSRSVLIRPPAGSGHNFPYQTPDAVLAVVRQAMRP